MTQSAPEYMKIFKFHLIATVSTQSPTICIYLFAIQLARVAQYSAIPVTDYARTKQHRDSRNFPFIARSLSDSDAVLSNHHLNFSHSHCQSNLLQLWLAMRHNSKLLPQNHPTIPSVQRRILADANLTKIDNSF